MELALAVPVGVVGAIDALCSRIFKEAFHGRVSGGAGGSSLSISGFQTQARSSDSRKGGLSLATHALPSKTRTKTRLRTPGAAGGYFSRSRTTVQAPDSPPSNPSRTSKITPQASAPPFPASNLDMLSSVGSVFALPHRLAENWGLTEKRFFILRSKPFPATKGTCFGKLHL